MNALSILLVFCSFFISYCFLMFADGELNFKYHELLKCYPVCTVLKCLHMIFLNECFYLN